MTIYGLATYNSIARDLELAVVFAGSSGFLHFLQLASHELAKNGRNVTKNKSPNSKYIPFWSPILLLLWKQ